MKMIFAILAGLVLASTAIADQVEVVRNELGSGTPGVQGFESAIKVGPDSGYLHAPQYMPMHPTAATIWPRVVEVPCIRNGNILKCEGYTWQPKLGRGEYLFIKPVVIEPVQPIIVTNTIVREVPVVKEVIVLKEVPIKKKRE